MPRKLNRRQLLENQAFLRALRRTGNAREAARSIGIHRATLTRRRAAHMDFAAEWDAALAIAHARLNAEESRRGGEGERSQQATGAHATQEPQVIRLANGRLQLRAPAARRLTRAHEQAFLAALSATANIRLSARAAGFSHSAFYHRRNTNPAFAREMRLALQIGYDRIEAALLAGYLPGNHRDDAWRNNEPPPIPAMTVAQALQLLYLHQKEARLWGERPDRRRRRGEGSAEHCARLATKWKAEKAWTAKAMKWLAPPARKSRSRPRSRRLRRSSPRSIRLPAGAKRAATRRTTPTALSSAAGGSVIARNSAVSRATFAGGSSHSINAA